MVLILDHLPNHLFYAFFRIHSYRIFQVQLSKRMYQSWLKNLYQSLQWGSIWFCLINLRRVSELSLPIVLFCAAVHLLYLDNMDER